MIERVEISRFDLRYESYRLKNPRAEKALLTSIAEQDILEPLEGVDNPAGDRILLNGFKRYRCSLKLKIETVPYRCLGDDEALGIIALIRSTQVKGLTILEQARLIDDLKNVHKMAISEIADHLGKSIGWVGMRLGILKEMSPVVTEKIFDGKFPAYSFMYTLRPFIRMKKIPGEEIDEFVRLVSGEGISIRDLDMLAKSYFGDAPDLREQIKEGNLSWVLSRIKESANPGSECSELERRMLHHLEQLRYYMGRIANGSEDKKLQSPSFLAQANIAVSGILKHLNNLKHSLERLYDRTGQKKSDLSPLS